MNIVHLGAGNLYGGIETLLVSYARAQELYPALHHRFVLTHPGRVERELRAAGAEVCIVGPVRLRWPLGVSSARNRLSKLLLSWKPDIVLSHGPWPHVVFAPAAEATRFPTILYLHAPLQNHWLDRLALKRLNAGAIANSEFTHSESLKWFPDQFVPVCYYPVLEPDAVDRGAVRRDLGVGDEVVILQASRFEPWKGIALHLQALEQLRQDNSWLAIFAGAAIRRSELRHLAAVQALAARLGIRDRVRFLGHRSDVRALMAGADIFCQPNLEPEPFGRVFIEALYASLPVVATNIGGAKEILANKWGILVGADPVSVGAALARLVSSKEARALLSKEGPKRALALCEPRKSLEAFHSLLEALRARYVARHVWA